MIHRDIGILATGQALTSTAMALLASISSLAGAYLAPTPLLSTLPVTATTLGTLIMIYSASSLMATYGRRNGFMIKATLGMTGSLVAMGALMIHSFLLFVLGTFVIGLFIAFGQYYRFAALEAAETIHRSAADHSPATSSTGKHSAANTLGLVMGAGVVGGILGPFLASISANETGSLPYTGAFGLLFVLCVALLVSQHRLSPQLGRSPLETPERTEGSRHTVVFSQEQETPSSARHTTRGGKQPAFWIITLAGTAAGGAMTLIMTATPLAMQTQHLALGTISLAMQVHFALMYLPSFIFPSILRRLGIRGTIGTGMMLGICGSLLPLYFPVSAIIQIADLGLVGLGWSLMSNGSTLLLSHWMGGAGRIKETGGASVSFLQGINTTVIYMASLITSLLAGVLLGMKATATLDIVAIFIWLMALPCLWPGTHFNARPE